MSALIRDAPIGQLLRWATNNKYLLYPEERPDFTCPSSYDGPTSPSEAVDEKLELPDPLTPGAHSLATPATIRDTEDPLDQEGQRIARRPTLSQIVSRPNLQNVISRADLEQVYTNAAERPAMKRLQSRPIEPETKEDGTILVDWYTTDDPENPQNWSNKKKAIVVLQIYLYTLAVYMGSAIYVPSTPYLMEIFGITQIVASLGLALYVLGYGVGPLIFSPLSEIPAIGRNPPYMITFGIFVILCIPTALARDIPSLLVLRFLQGLFGSPCLATGGASIGDLHSLLTLPYFLTGWAAFATCGPALGPLISGFSVPARNWRWSLWEMLWLSGPVFLSLFFFLPETNSATILLRRAKRLRKLSRNQNLKSQSEIDQANLSVRKELIANLWHPVQINVLDPAVLFTSVYVGLIYAIFYSFFEVFPIVYADGGYGFNSGELGLVFLCISVAVLIAIPSYFIYLKKVWVPFILTKGLPAPERALIPALFVVILPPVGLFLFAWTARNSIHWILPTLGVTIFTIGVFILLQCIFLYIPMNYPQYAASLFAFNDFARSGLAFAAILFSTPLFHDLGVARGVTLLAGLTILGVIGIFVLYVYGANLRARSRFTAK
jgi:MFS transporter, DHA1 family, multidrug resistance protein